ncbi:hypothetical protein A3A79_03750 [Candidatus Gottesmanbacteria bacterium RIFCSPLOWO2_01_FULL_43_11b]|uniref:Thioredoxin domain-containing protein n=1 Tax=Candidatus Gottesmanbacteria bacterium RIFCSPLOWO2_01_FULL_43_11b TaxID=1798392 RepID=A0A1F6AHS2_9BACT|nr:MAG: hypothetical protein A3A79_03750 [Candidatus Gottesmanbacteria bacterium RIFCSPLOWO2_01_FULL_43_11b]
MSLLILFAFLGGIVTILSPCILPILPIVLSGGIAGGKQRPLGIILGFIVSFTFFTLFLNAIVRLTGISSDALRLVAVFVITFFGISMVLGKEIFKISFMPKTTNGFLLGMSLGLVWTPCVGPILAAIIALAATSTVGLDAVLITLSYSAGTSLPMLIILYGGRKFIKTSPNIQKIFGVLMILTAVAIYFSWDRQFQTYILTKFPNYGVGLTKLEDNDLVRKQLVKMKDPPNLGKAPEPVVGGQWFNGNPTTIASLRGKVVLLDFWTYTCINCIRTLPYLKNWHTKYKDKGLVIIGVHTPEFEFEKNPNNVAKAIKDFGLEYLVMQDNDYATWTAFSNRYWPAKYLIDKEGNIRYTHFGEGEYDQTEKKIQELLLLDMPIDNPTYEIQSRTPETYLGAARGDYSRISTSGTWTKSPEFAMPGVGATLTFRFNAAKVFLVMRGNGKVNIYLDDEFVKEVSVDSDRLYELINLPQPGDHILKLEFPDDNVELYAFTFG